MPKQCLGQYYINLDQICVRDGANKCKYVGVDAQHWETQPKALGFIVMDVVFFSPHAWVGSIALGCFTADHHPLGS